MADVRWIKIVVDIFDDEKILLNEQLPQADSIMLIWFKLLCLAGKQNNRGVFTLCGSMPYTDEMFAAVFRRPLNAVRLALATFEKFGMVSLISGTVTIPNWGKHQNIEGMEKRKDYMRGYIRQYKQDQKTLADGQRLHNHSRKPDVSVPEEEKEPDKNKDPDKKPESEKHMSIAAQRYQYGEYRNVLLTDGELAKLKAEISNWEKMVNRLSCYMKSTAASSADKGFCGKRGTRDACAGRGFRPPFQIRSFKRLRGRKLRSPYRGSFPRRRRPSVVSPDGKYASPTPPS